MFIILQGKLSLGVSLHWGYYAMYYTATVYDYHCGFSRVLPGELIW